MKRQVFWAVVAVLLSLILIYFVYFIYGNWKELFFSLSIKNEKIVNINSWKDIILSEKFKSKEDDSNSFFSGGIYNFWSWNMNDDYISWQKNVEVDINTRMQKKMKIKIFAIDTWSVYLFSEDNKKLFTPFVFFELEDYSITWTLNILSWWEIIIFWSTGLTCDFFVKNFWNYIKINYIFNKSILKKNKLPGEKVCFLNMDEYKKKYVFWGIFRFDRWIWFKLPFKQYYDWKLKLYKLWTKWFRDIRF